MAKFLTENIKALGKMTSTLPKTLTEALGDFDSTDIDIPKATHSQEPEPSMQQSQPEKFNSFKLIASIRKQALKGMAELADHPDDPDYETLKKIFMMLDKSIQAPTTNQVTDNTKD